MKKRLDYQAINQAAIARMAHAKLAMDKIDGSLRALIELRVSQINGCAYCVDKHCQEARDAGETQQRLDCLVVWQESGLFSKAEQAALAWAEALTLLPTKGAPQDLYNDLGAYFDNGQIVDLTLIIAQMNAWNRLAVGFEQGPELRA